MKKLFALFIAIVLMSAVAAPAFADYASTDCYDTKYLITNTTGAAKISTVPSTLISGDGKYVLLAVTVGPTNGGTGTSAEALVGIYDSSTILGASNGNLECEIESYNEETTTMQWVRPLKIYNGVTVVQGAYSVVTIEYMRVGA